MRDYEVMDGLRALITDVEREAMGYAITTVASDPAEAPDCGELSKAREALEEFVRARGVQADREAAAAEERERIALIFEERRHSDPEALEFQDLWILRTDAARIARGTDQEAPNAD